MSVKKMTLFATVIISSVFFLLTESSAETINYAYDNMLRLMRAEYGDGTVIQYTYDNLGNRLQKTTTLAGSPGNNPPSPATTPNPLDSSTELVTTPTLTWTGGGDPDIGDDVVYYVHFGTEGNLSLTSSGRQTTYTAGQLRSLTTYQWQVISIDNQGAETAGPVWSFTTGNSGPIAAFIANNIEGGAPLIVGFRDASTSLDDEIVSWAWDFNNDGIIDSNLQNSSYTYTSAGTYTVRLTVTDERGATATEIKTAFIIVHDTDGDGLEDENDNCPAVYNPDQADMDGDGIGDLCDSDIDGDGIPNTVDNCITTLNPDQADANNDGYGDACTVTHCVANSLEFQNALSAAQSNGRDNVIQLVQGTYGISGNNNAGFYYDSDEPYSVVIKGGYTSGCTSREMNSSNTILDGENINQDSGPVLFLRSFGFSPLEKVAVEGITIQNGKAGGLFIGSYNKAINMANNLVKENFSNYKDGGVTLYSEHGHITLVNNIIRNNTATIGGGGVVAKAYFGNIDIISNTITGNSVTYSLGSAGGLYIYLLSESSQANIYNNIIWGNTATQGGDLAIDDGVGMRTVNAYNNDFDPAKVSGTFTNEGNNINADPLFVDASNGDYHLSSGSPAIDSGINPAPSLPSTDFEGDNRVRGLTVDIGADEYHAAGTTYTLRGQILSGGVGAEGVTVTLTGSYTATKITDSNGDYVFTWAPDGNYSITPSSLFYVFSPNERVVTISGADVLNQDFEATALDTDGDGIPDFRDNCPSVPNVGQADSDNDGNGDLCDLPGSVSGIVIDEETGLGIGGAQVNFFTFYGLESDAFAYTNALGIYTITGLEAGYYIIYADATGYSGEFYDNTYVESTANALVVNAGTHISDINFGLAIALDIDEDGILDPTDNCATIANPDQDDSDSDGIGDMCDSCVQTPNPDQADMDGDGFGDACTVRHCVTNSAEFQNALMAAPWNEATDVIQLVQGTYGVTGNNNTGFSYYIEDQFQRYSVVIKGGYTPGCASRERHYSNTILDGENTEGAGPVLSLESYDSSPFIKLVIEDITIRNGKAGGLRAHTEGGTLTLANNLIEENYAEEGGGVFFSSNQATLTNNIIRNNTAVYGGAGVNGYGIFDNAVLTLANNVISGNYAQNTGGVLIEASSWQGANITLINNIVTNNTATLGGVGVTTYQGKIDIINNTITNNSATDVSWSLGGLNINIYDENSQANIYSNIIWGNTGFYGEILIDNEGGLRTVNVYNNDLDPEKAVGEFTNEGNNINADPMFVDAPNGDYHLSQISPLINMGNNSAPSLPSTDFSGSPRISNEIVDIGAHELQP